MKTLVRVCRALASGLLCLGLGSHVATAQSFPSKPITIVVPGPAGGAPDALARQLARRMSGHLSQPVIVENRSGGAGTIGTAHVAKSSADGHTLVLVNMAHAVNPHVYSNLSYDAIKDFTPVVLLTALPNVLFVRSSSPITTLGEFLALAKSKPDGLTFATSGTGGAGHLTSELFMQSSGTKLLHVPYKGAALAVLDFLGGQVDSWFGDPSVAAPHIKSGAIRALAVSAPNRIPMLPDVPTFTEAGVKGVEVSIWLGMLAPANTPSDIIDLLNQEFVTILRDPEMTALITESGQLVVASTPAEFAEVIKTDFDKYGTLVESIGIKSN